MIDDNVRYILQDLIIRSCEIVFFILLFKDELRISARKASVILVLFQGVAFAVQLILPSSPVVEILYVVINYALLVWLFRRNQVNNLITYGLWLVLDDFAGAILISAVFAGISLIRGGGISWFVQSKAGVGMVVLTCIIMIFSYLAMFFVVRKIRPYIITLSGWIQKVLLILMPICSMYNTIIKNASGQNQEYTNNPSGTLFIVDCLTSICYILGILILGIYILLNIRSENKRIKQRIDEEYNSYKDLLVIREQIRELNHELRGLSITGDDQKHG